MSTLSCAEGIPSFDGAFDFCSPNFVFGEIEQVIITPLETESGNPYPADWTNETSWDTILTATTPDEPVGFMIPVRGTIDEPDRPEIEASNYRKAYPPKRYSITASVDDLSDAAYTALRQMMNRSVRLWFISGGYIFGGPQGIVTETDSWLTIEEGEDSMHRYHILFTWRSADAAQRSTSPFEATEATPTV